MTTTVTSSDADTAARRLAALDRRIIATGRVVDSRIEVTVVHDSTHPDLFAHNVRRLLVALAGPNVTLVTL